VTRPDPRYGLVPNLVGSSLEDARARLGKLELSPRITYGTGLPGTVVEQTPPAGVAAGPGLKMELVVARGKPSETP